MPTGTSPRIGICCWQLTGARSSTARRICTRRSPSARRWRRSSTGWEDARPRPRNPDAVRELLDRHGSPTPTESSGLMEWRRGELKQYERPVWEPLIDLVGLDVVGGFMWMHEVEFDDGLEVHAYKSIATRRYLHLAVDGRAFALSLARALRGDPASGGAARGVHGLGGVAAPAARSGRGARAAGPGSERQRWCSISVCSGGAGDMRTVCRLTGLCGPPSDAAPMSTICSVAT